MNFLFSPFLLMDYLFYIEYTTDPQLLMQAHLWKTPQVNLYILCDRGLQLEYKVAVGFSQL